MVPLDDAKDVSLGTIEMLQHDRPSLNWPPVQVLGWSMPSTWSGAGIQRSAREKPCVMCHSFSHGQLSMMHFRVFFSPLVTKKYVIELTFERKR
jgi:hypothetical protein